MVTLMTFIGLAHVAVGVEYAQKFCHYQTQSIILQASPFQTNSELEQQCHYQLFLQKLFRDPDMLHVPGAEIYM